ncbi:MAG: MBL fold metallo-hydrolase [Firmicutes bacterium]|nr:MBL fold metallo-hydrolase [Bacillota bacterium]
MQQLADGVWVVEPQGAPRYPYGNCMFIDDERPTVIDFGAGASSFAALKRESVEIGIFSHFHHDHVHGDTLFPNIRLLAGREEEDNYRSRESYMRHFGFQFWEELMGQLRWLPYAKTIVGGLSPDVVAPPGFRTIDLAGTFTDNQVLDLGRRKLTALHLPGHTAGHYGFYLEEEGILFSGDIDLTAGGPWYFGESSDLTALFASVSRIKKIGPGILVPSHRRVFTAGINEGLDKFVKVVLDREEKVLEALKEPQTVPELAERRILFPARRNMYEEFWEKMGLRNHLKRLLKMGAVIKEEDGRYRRTG